MLTSTEPSFLWGFKIGLKQISCLLWWCKHLLMPLHCMQCSSCCFQLPQLQSYQITSFWTHVYCRKTKQNTFVRTQYKIWECNLQYSLTVGFKTLRNIARKVISFPFCWCWWWFIWFCSLEFLSDALWGGSFAVSFKIVYP